jgi:hypothetical protein
MRHSRAFVRFWWDFVVGDDWRIAAGVAAALGLCALLVHESGPAWWLLPLAVLALLAESLRRVIRGSVGPSGQSD